MWICFGINVWDYALGLYIYLEHNEKDSQESGFITDARQLDPSSILNMPEPMSELSINLWRL